MVPRCSYLDSGVLVREPYNIVAKVEDGKLSLQSNVSQDAKRRALVILDAAVAVRPVDLSIIHVWAWDDASVRAQSKGKVRQRCGAREHHHSHLAAHDRAVDLRIIGVDDVGGGQEQRGASVGDGIPGAVYILRIVAADAVTAEGDFPQGALGIDGCILDGARILGGVDVAKVIVAGLALLKVGCEERLHELALDVVKVCALLGGTNCIASTEGGTQNAGREGVVADVFGDLDGRLNGLCVEECVADLYTVLVDDAVGAGTVSILDNP